MKSLPRQLAVILFVFGSAHLLPTVRAKEAPATEASIHTKGKLKATERASLAKVSFVAALKTALSTVQGKVVSADIEAEDGNLIYSFQIVTGDKKVVDVVVDAGDGKILEVSEGDDDLG